MSLKLAIKRILLLACGACILAIPVSLLYSLGSASRPDNAQAELQEAILSGLPVLVALHSQGCAYCKADRPLLDDLEEAYRGELVVVRVDVGTDYGSTMAQELGIRGVPAYFLIEPGTGDLLYAQTGPLNVERLVAALP